MKHRFATAVGLAVLFLAVLLSMQAAPSTAHISPVETASAQMSPLATPAALPVDPYYVETPKKVTPRAVPYVNEYGETVVREEVIEHPHREANVIRYYATPQPTIVKPAMTQQMTSDPRPTPGPTTYYTMYLPTLYNPMWTNANVLVIVYVPSGITPTNDPSSATFSLTNWIRSGTTWHGYSNPSATPSIAFHVIDDDITVVNGWPPVQSSGHLDLNAIYQQYAICDRIAADEVDEVWIFVNGENPFRADKSYSLAEFTIRDQNWSDYLDMPTPYCGQRMFTMLLNYDTSTPNAFESWTHSAEESWLLYVNSSSEACDVLTNSGYDTWSKYGWHQSQCTGSLAYSDLYAFTSRPAITNSNVGMCGDAHMPPNRLATETVEYIWNDPASRTNRCTDWQWGNAVSNGNVSCSTWGCTQAGFDVWYLQNAPGLNNDSHGRSGALRPNWWNFRLTP